ncbi:MAG: Crp/Fnr family transcriptional regulator [Rhodobacteraceae bacterium]|nr:Crp/Fnr family transcriptional regulator [Paracoccaceae bacterium]
MTETPAWTDRFPALADMSPELKRQLAEDGRVVRAPAGTVIFAPGMPADNFLLVVSGVVRVQHLSESGRGIVLYRVNAGESCVLTTACLMAHEAYSAEGISETAVEAVMLPRRAFDALVAASASFRGFVFDAYSRRITDLFLLLDEVAFQRIDARLAQKLLDLARDGDSLQATHQQLADELGTAREVVSRQLQEFRRRGLVAASRGAVEIRDRAGLQALAASD